MTKSTEQILERIRELVPELKELKFGCEITGGNKKATVLLKPARSGNPYTILVGELITTGEIYPAQIIGLPVHLENLLSALRKSGYPISHYKVQAILGIGTFENSKARYNTDLFFEQNLKENEALRNLISELIF